MVFEYRLEHGPRWAATRPAPAVTGQVATYVAATFPERAAVRPALATAVHVAVTFPERLP